MPTGHFLSGPSSDPSARNLLVRPVEFTAWPSETMHHVNSNLYSLSIKYLIIIINSIALVLTVINSLRRSFHISVLCRF